MYRFNISHNFIEPLHSLYISYQYYQDMYFHCILKHILIHLMLSNIHQYIFNSPQHYPYILNIYHQINLCMVNRSNLFNCSIHWHRNAIHIIQHQLFHCHNVYMLRAHHIRCNHFLR